MTTYSQERLKCLLYPFNNFGDHTKGFTGCLWCGQIVKCVKFHPTQGLSLWFRDDIQKPVDRAFRVGKTLEKNMNKELDEDQKEFIKKKVEELGSVESVKRLYRKDCPVDDYANGLAKEMFKPQKLRRN